MIRDWLIFFNFGLLGCVIGDMTERRHPVGEALPVTGEMVIAAAVVAAGAIVVAWILDRMLAGIVAGLSWAINAVCFWAHRDIE